MPDKTFSSQVLYNSDFDRLHFGALFKTVVCYFKAYDSSLLNHIKYMFVNMLSIHNKVCS